MPTQQPAAAPVLPLPGAAPVIPSHTYLPPGQFRTDSATDLLNLSGIGQRASQFRFDLLDQTNSVIGTCLPDAGTPPTLKNDATLTIKRSLSGLVLPPGVLDQLNPYTDRIRPVMILENGAQFPWGVLLFASADGLLRTNGTTTTGTLVDQGLIVDQPVPGPVVCPAGSIVSDYLAILLSRVGMVGSIDVSFVTTGPTDIVWPGGTSLMKIVVDVCTIGGYYPLYFDNTGVPVLRLVPDLASAEPDVSYATGNWFANTAVVSTFTLDAPNRYVVIDTSSAAGPVFGIWDIPDTAPNSAVNRGYVISKQVPVQGVGSSPQADAAAKAYGQQDAQSYAHVIFSGAPDPRHDTFDVVSWFGVNYRERSWTLPLTEGADMAHELRLVYS